MKYETIHTEFTNDELRLIVSNISKDYDPISQTLLDEYKNVFEGLGHVVFNAMVIKAIQTMIDKETTNE